MRHARDGHHTPPRRRRDLGIAVLTALTMTAAAVGSAIADRGARVDKAMQPTLGPAADDGSLTATRQDLRRVLPVPAAPDDRA